MALTPGTKCPCGCGCAIPKNKTAKGCPCVCAGTCPTCGPAPRAKAETVGPQRTPTHPVQTRPISVETAPSSTRTIRESAMPAHNAATLTADQFARLLAAVTENRARNEAAQAARVAEAREAARAAEVAELHTLDQQQLGQRLVSRLTETWGMRSPGWTAGRRVAETASTTAQQPTGLAEQAQALPASQQSMTLTEAMVAARDLKSPAWTRPAGLQGVRSIFDAPAGR